MTGFKKHFALVLLAGFLFPQAANSVHQFLMPHAGYFGEKGLSHFAAPPYEYHSCDYQIFGMKFVIPKAGQEDLVLNPAYSKKEECGLADDDLIIELAFHYSLRGPPDPMISRKTHLTHI